MKFNVYRKIGRVKELKSSRATLTSRTQRLISGITVAETDCLIMLRTRELCHHFLEFPDTRHIALQVNFFHMIEFS